MDVYYKEKLHANHFWELKGKQTVVRGLLSGDRPPVTGFIGILQMKHTSSP